MKTCFVSAFGFTLLGSVALAAGQPIPAPPLPPAPPVHLERIALDEDAPFLGVLLNSDDAAMDLLRTHLGLDEDQGALIMNVREDSPADEAGLERSDIVVAVDGKAVKGPQHLSQLVRSREPGDEVSLEIIHRGQRQTKTVKLASMQDGGEWKYPVEPESRFSWEPGKLFYKMPGEEDWSQLEFEDLDLNLPRPHAPLTNEVRTYSYAVTENGEAISYVVTIIGNPKDPQTRVLVVEGSDSWTTTVGEMDQLPERVRAYAERALDEARRQVRSRPRVQPPHFDPGRLEEMLRNLPRPAIPAVPEPPRVPDGVAEKLERQMDKLRQQMQKLEDQNKELMEKLQQQMNELRDKLPQLRYESAEKEKTI